MLFKLHVMVLRFADGLDGACDVTPVPHILKLVRVPQKLEMEFADGNVRCATWPR